ncbi:kelch domain-containing protein [Plasmodium gonderi]|uniref:Kelch domain-containing protein n=1 Tax=Plasmodium gonderi TaxID=77519 RepID=A0A1Y1JDV0_PLAGO|nr:kelch domain-containing protein [Plasmodium gonderi]GAW79387.1 kelch domain-containing protein [Plasmodium gonderi]
MGILSKDISNIDINKSDFLNEEKNIISTSDNVEGIHKDDIFTSISFTSNGTSEGTTRNALTTKNIQITNNDNNANSAYDIKTARIQICPAENNKSYMNGGKGEAEKSKMVDDEADGEVHIVYSYVVNDSKKKILSNSELITMRITSDKDKNYTVKMKIKKLPFFRYGHFLCLTKNGAILAIGGSDGEKKYGLVEKYCVGKQMWKQINLIHFPRSSFCGICTEDNDLFILGGEGNQDILKSVEYCDSKINSWRSLPPLNCVRHSASAIIFQNKIFIMGGKDGIGEYGKVHKSVEMLNLKEKKMKWVMCKPLKQARLGHAAIIFQDKLYAIGGSTGVKDLNSVEIYDFQKEEWIGGPSLNFPRFNFVVFIWNNQLVAYGGVSKHKGDLIKSAEILNEKGTYWLLLNESVPQ